MASKPLAITDEVPYFGWVSPDAPVFFRPRMRQLDDREEVPFYLKEASALSDAEIELKKQLPWSGKEHVVLEYCSGNGHWIAAQAARHSDKFWIGLEKRLVRSKKIFSKQAHAKLDNLAIACTEAKWFSRHFLDTASLEGIYINFPDPWPKDKHQRHRLFEQVFVQEMVRALKDGATIQLVSDDKRYIEQAVAVMLEQEELVATLESPDAWEIVDLEGWGYSFFGELWQSMGRLLYRTEFARKARLVKRDYE